MFDKNSLRDKLLATMLAHQQLVGVFLGVSVHVPLQSKLSNEAEIALLTREGAIIGDTTQFMSE